MPLYRIAYVSNARARSIVRELSLDPVLGEELALDANTVVAVKEIVLGRPGDTITAEISAEPVAQGDIGTTPRVTESGSRSSS
jgi:hypothetical protein